LDQPETDQLLKDYVATADAAKLAEISTQLQIAYAENMPSISLFSGPVWYEWSTLRFTGWPTQEDYYVRGAPWSDDSGERLVVLMKLHCISEEACAQAK